MGLFWTSYEIVSHTFIFSSCAYILIVKHYHTPLISKFVWKIECNWVLGSYNALISYLTNPMLPNMISSSD
jgi:hypothetical protein